MKVAIVGSRNYFRLQDVDEYVATLPAGTIVISGAARGVDQRAAKAARARGLEVHEYPADWDTHGKAAGFIRNRVMDEQADEVAVFWDGESKGTRHSMNLADSMGKLGPVKICETN